MAILSLFLRTLGIALHEINNWGNHPADECVQLVVLQLTASVALFMDWDLARHFIVAAVGDFTNHRAQPRHMEY
jgi:hypothetical protein